MAAAQCTCRAARAAPVWRDTINLRPGERVELLVPFWDYAGTSLFHCHIAEHHESGMMFNFRVDDAVDSAAGRAPKRVR